MTVATKARYEYDKQTFKYSLLASTDAGAQGQILNRNADPACCCDHDDFSGACGSDSCRRSDDGDDVVAWVTVGACPHHRADERREGRDDFRKTSLTAKYSWWKLWNVVRLYQSSRQRTGQHKRWF